ncbi:thermonuclease family protein [Myxococcota bacterium]
MRRTQHTRTFCGTMVLSWIGTMACTVTGDDHQLPPPAMRGDHVFRLEDPVSILRVTDGDTIDVDFNGQQESVRFKGIDAPELFTDPPEPFAAEARNFVFDHTGSEVDLEFDSHCAAPPECRDSTSSRRMLAYIRLADGSDLGARLLEEGLAAVFVFAGQPFDRQSEYEAIETEAQANGKGMWQQ